jgi:hypothetical protein
VSGIKPAETKLGKDLLGCSACKVGLFTIAHVRQVQETVLSYVKLHIAFLESGFVFYARLSITATLGGSTSQSFPKVLTGV